ncbi:hypothetical protein MKZ07_22715 [Paenibacillus sp. FSL P4-0338]|uniref:hypothetical protein n=1 Tax=unclassified Paenibacillus TaxID=185978 RepID=UPI0003E22C79|nr:hypothetical protein [Paenibacillus sp. FSL R7-269]ETT54554.1 hypothetical protein C162_04029 [Paenibacillus sp. FSL R7-269]
MSCHPLCDTTIESIVKYNDDPWTIVDAWTSLDYEGGTIKQLSIEDRTLTAVNEHDELRIEINLDHLTEMKLIPCRK